MTHQHPTASSTCSLRDPKRPDVDLCAQRSSFFRTDGLCHYHGLVADGLTGTSSFGVAPGLRGGVRRGERECRWQVWVDGQPHPEPPEANKEWRKHLTAYASRRGLEVHRLLIDNRPHLQVLPREAVA
jgi:hypothetical protein